MNNLEKFLPPNNNKEIENQSEYDEDTIPEEFINPHPADDNRSYKLPLDDINIPISFTHNEKGLFRINGLESSTNKGVIISGRLAEEVAKINHIIIHEQLKNLGVAKTLLTELEKNLTDEKIKTIYAGFAKPKTIEFFLKNGYTIVPVNILTDEIKRQIKLNSEDFDIKVSNEENFKSLKENDLKTLKKVLLKKDTIPKNNSANIVSKVVG